MVVVKERKQSLSSGSVCIELICIGNELLIGKILNTNGKWLSRQISRIGGRVTRITVVGDNIQDIVSAIRQALIRRPEFIITSGGLGPTHDDITLKAASKALGKSLRLNETAIQLMKAHYGKMVHGKRIRLNKHRLKMARIPENSIPIENPAGSAPAVHIMYRQITLICLPGVPKELKAIFERTVKQMIRAKTGKLSFIEDRIKLKGMVESEISSIIDRVMDKFPNIYIKSHPKGGKVPEDYRLEIHFSSTSSDKTKTKQEIKKSVSMFLQSIERISHKETIQQTNSHLHIR